MVGEGDDMVADGIDKDFLDQVLVEVHSVLVSLLEHEPGVEVFHIEYVRVDLFEHELV